MPSMIIIVLGAFILVAAVYIFAEAKPSNKPWGVVAMLITITLWTWVAVAASDRNVIESERVYPVDTLTDGTQVVALSDDGGRVVNMNIEMGRGLPVGAKVKRTVWRSVYRGIDFKVDSTRPASLKDTWELVK